VATVGQIRNAIKATLKTGIPGLNVYEAVEDVVECPAAVVSIRPGNALHPSATFEGAFARGLDEWYFEVWLFVNRRSGAYAQKELDEYLTGSGPKSIRQCLYLKPDVGLGDGTDVDVKSMMNYGAEYSYLKIPHVGATLNLCVRTSGS
jgi:hypothetical protein